MFQDIDRVEFQSAIRKRWETDLWGGCLRLLVNRERAQMFLRVKHSNMSLTRGLTCSSETTFSCSRVRGCSGSLISLIDWLSLNYNFFRNLCYQSQMDKKGTTEKNRKNAVKRECEKTPDPRIQSFGCHPSRKGRGGGGGETAKTLIWGKKMRGINANGWEFL